MGVVAVASVMLVPRGVAGAPCAPRAELEGDRAAIVRVTAELQQLGVETGAPAAGCRALRARVELDRDGGLDIAIVDGSRRSEGRVVANAAVAAAWIDSWLREDLDGIGHALAASAIVPATPGARPAARVAVRDDAPPGMHDDGGAPAASPSAFERFALGAAYEQTWTEDGGSGSGLTASACLRVGGVCFGARARFARDGDRAVNLTSMARSDASLLATASASFAVGRMQLAPELGVGLGRRTTRRIESCSAPPPKCEPNTPNCDPTGGTSPPPGDPTCTDPNAAKGYVGDKLDETTYTPRAAASLHVAIPLFDHVWLDGLASVTVAPFGHGDFAPRKTPQPPLAPLDQLALPADPLAAFQLAVGLRIGGP